MKLPEYTYLIAYLHSSGMGRATVQRSRPIISTDDILELDASLTKTNGFDCQVFSFNMLGTN